MSSYTPPSDLTDPTSQGVLQSGLEPSFGLTFAASFTAASHGTYGTQVSTPILGDVNSHTQSYVPDPLESFISSSNEYESGLPFNLDNCSAEVSLHAVEDDNLSASGVAASFGQLDEGVAQNGGLEDHAFISPCDLELHRICPNIVISQSTWFETSNGASSGAKDTSSATGNPEIKIVEPQELLNQHDQTGNTFRGPRRGRVAKRNAPIKEWLLSNASSPYPNQDQLSHLSASSGLSVRQVKVCLSNLRARTKPDKGAHDSSQTSPAMDLQSPTNELSQFLDQGTFYSTSTYSAFSYGANISPPRPVHKCEPEQGNFETGDFELDDADSLPITQPENLGYSPDGRSSAAAGTQLPSTLKRKGKRHYQPRALHAIGQGPISYSPRTTSDSGTDVLKMYHCTVCPKSFKGAYNWKRHESGVHGFNNIEWICMLDDTIMADMKCIFCSDIVDDPDHFDRHNLHICLGKGTIERTFSRKDLLKQHVQHAHLATANDYIKKGFDPPDIWSTQASVSYANPDALWCGFCQRMLETNAMRMEHVAQHFRDGQDMTTWVFRLPA